jgi:hypothetical protein
MKKPLSSLTRIQRLLTIYPHNLVLHGLGQYVGGMLTEKGLNVKPA